jgi:hypothetical protein
MTPFRFAPPDVNLNASVSEGNKQKKTGSAFYDAAGFFIADRICFYLETDRIPLLNTSNLTLIR